MTNDALARVREGTSRHATFAELGHETEMRAALDDLVATNTILFSKCAPPRFAPTI